MAIDICNLQFRSLNMRFRLEEILHSYNYVDLWLLNAQMSQHDQREFHLTHGIFWYLLCERREIRSANHLSFFLANPFFPLRQKIAKLWHGLGGTEDSQLRNTSNVLECLGDFPTPAIQCFTQLCLSSSYDGSRSESTLTGVCPNVRLTNHAFANWLWRAFHFLNKHTWKPSSEQHDGIAEDNLLLLMTWSTSVLSQIPSPIFGLFLVKLPTQTSPTQDDIRCYFSSQVIVICLRFDKSWLRGEHPTKWRWNLNQERLSKLHKHMKC